MTLRLALLLVSLITLAVIGLVCHRQYRRLHPPQQQGDKNDSVDTDAGLEEEIHAPFITDNLVSDVADHTVSLLPSTQIVNETDPEEPSFELALKSSEEQQQIAQKLAAELLPVHTANSTVLEHTAVLVNIRQKAKRLKAVTQARLAGQDKAVTVNAQAVDCDEFVSLDLMPDKTRINHLKLALQLVDKQGAAGAATIEKFETRIRLIASDLGCEYRLALTPEQAESSASEMNEFLQENDFIIILYMLAQPDSTFTGASIEAAMARAGLKHGEFGFYHFDSSSEQNQGLRLYSLANMFKPGNFDIKSMDQFSTSGLCAFMVPALLADPGAGFREMCVNCKAIVDQLEGVLTTDKRELLNEQNYADISKQITQYCDLLQQHGIQCGSETAVRLFG